ncbi:cobyrinate a,c-diamide synthase [Phormidium sp. CCY1219]|uniref:cobyrinate a,c-diamide synthase n=1 Tax=Phormidium sp. CCY1219 TaxID=2886104 RepID=UPI002D1EBD53|nr:cobyrinate a,c-diamide synthase [Phormidium sp. CCY1219]MEB3828391.1 cobyrinate a,c-diamide synthase [Phormidium sp. CCY1219]
MAIVIAGERSGAGKTTLTLMLLAYLTRHQLTVQSFKVGPDYIDPMFHQYVTGRACRNLDPVLTSENYVQQCFHRHSQTSECALVEGVMGLFDGVRMTDKLTVGDFASTAHIARVLGLPVVLTIDCSRLSGSVAAIAQGYSTFDPRVQLAGVILNRVGSDRHQQLLEDALEPLQIPILGVLRREDKIAIPDRHLGLVPTAELPELDRVIDRLAHLAETCLNWERLLPLLRTQHITPPEVAGLTIDTQNVNFQSAIRIAIARDAAFSFYYQDNLDLLAALGAELVPWSPLGDRALPEAVGGLYFGGGFPEMFAEQLANNSDALQAVKQAIKQGMPTYGECGGLMYLGEKIVDFAGESWPMVGILPTSTVMGTKLTLGYRQATALQDTPILLAKQKVFAHEFHRSHLTREPESPLFQIQSFQRGAIAATEGWGGTVKQGTAFPQVHASYLHLHWGGTPEIPRRFLQNCQRFARKMGTSEGLRYNR